MPLTDTHLMLLSQASQRDDGLLPHPAKLVGIALLRLEGSFIKAGVAERVPVRTDQPQWRRDEADTPIGLQITDAGLAALGLEAPSAIDPNSPEHAPMADEASLSAIDSKDSSERPQIAVSLPRAYRPSSKRALLVTMLGDDHGVSIDALVAALSWQPHTVRAALTRLRQSGTPVRSSKNAKNKTMYRIDTEADEPIDTLRAAEKAA